MNGATVDYQEACNAMIKGVQAWDDVVAQNLLVVNQSPCNLNIKADLFNSDGITAIGFADLNAYPYSCNGCAALTSKWTKPAASYEIYEVDILLNTVFPWSIGQYECDPRNGATSCQNAYGLDIQSVVTHEGGHLYGMRDVYRFVDDGNTLSFNSKYFNLTMYGYTGIGNTIERTLEPGDIEGIKSLYEYGFVTKYQPPNTNIIKNPTFENKSYWTFYTNGYGLFTSSFGYANIAILKTSSNTQLYQKGLSLNQILNTS